MTNVLILCGTPGSLLNYTMRLPFPFVVTLTIKNEKIDANPRVYEPRHDKTNKMSVRLARTQISRGIRPV